MKKMIALFLIVLLFIPYGSALAEGIGNGDGKILEEESSLPVQQDGDDESLSVVQNVVISPGTEQVYFQWTGVKNASSYGLYYTTENTTDTAAFKNIATTVAHSNPTSIHSHTADRSAFKADNGNGTMLQSGIIYIHIESRDDDHNTAWHHQKIVLPARIIGQTTINSAIASKANVSVTVRRIADPAADDIVIKGYNIYYILDDYQKKAGFIAQGTDDSIQELPANYDRSLFTDADDQPINGQQVTIKATIVLVDPEAASGEQEGSIATAEARTVLLPDNQGPAAPELQIQYDHTGDEWGDVSDWISDCPTIKWSFGPAQEADFDRLEYAILPGSSAQPNSNTVWTNIDNTTTLHPQQNLWNNSYVLPGQVIADLPSGEYSIFVRANDVNGNDGTYAKVVYRREAKYSPEGITPLTANDIYVGAGTGSVTATWRGASVNGSFSIDGYELYYTTENTTDSAKFTLLGTVVYHPGTDRHSITVSRAALKQNNGAGDVIQMGGVYLHLLQRDTNGNEVITKKLINLPARQVSQTTWASPGVISSKVDVVINFNKVNSADDLPIKQYDIYYTPAGGSKTKLESVPHDDSIDIYTRTYDRSLFVKNGQLVNDQNVEIRIQVVASSEQGDLKSDWATAEAGTVLLPDNQGPAAPELQIKYDYTGDEWGDASDWINDCPTIKWSFGSAQEADFDRLEYAVLLGTSAQPDSNTAWTNIDNTTTLHAQQQNLWNNSYVLPGQVIADLPSGEYSIFVRANDVNGNDGTYAKVVYRRKAEHVPVTGLTLDQDYYYHVGTHALPKISISPSNADKESIDSLKWHTYVHPFFEIKDGKLVAKKIGAERLSAICEGNVYASTRIHVVDPVTKVTLDKKSATLYGPQFFHLTSTTYPLNTTNPNVIWSSSNEKVIKVDAFYIHKDHSHVDFKSVGIGTAVLTATTVDGKKIASCTVTVKPMKTNMLPFNYSGCVGDSQRLMSTSEAKKYTWSASNKKVVSISNGVVKLLSPGKATVKVTTKDGLLYDICACDVSPQRLMYVQLPTSKKVNSGSTYRLKPTYGNKKAAVKSVKWSSSDKSIATVSSSGVVTAKKVGGATITLTVSDGYGKYTAKCIINTTLAAPTKVKAAPASTTKNKVSWGKVSGADCYHLYRSTSKNGTYRYIGKFMTTSYTDSGLKRGKKYYYKVRAYAENKVERVTYVRNSAYSAIVVSAPALVTPSGVKASISKKNVLTVNWNRRKEASGYQVYTSTKQSSGYKRAATITKNTTLTLKKTGYKKGKTYYIKVRSYKILNGKRIYSPFGKVIRVR